MTIIDNQRGNMFFYILLAVALFAALSYAVATSMRGNTGVSNERQKLIATEIIDAGSRVAEAVTRLRIRGVAKNAISFENAVDAAYTNPDCTSDTCKVFANAGGGLSWETPPPNLTPSPFFFSGALAIGGVGTTSGDLVMYLSVVPAEVCSHINEMLGNTQKGDAIPLIASTLNAVDAFVGTYGSTLVSTPELVGKKAGCVQVDSISGSLLGTVNNAYHYYQVLVAN